MSILYEKCFRPFIFKKDPEQAHDQAIRYLRYLGKCKPLCALMELYNKAKKLPPVKLWGLQFSNPIGLAPGFDKNAECWQAAAALGFGYVEVGTVTPFAQLGNPHPRLFRYPAQEAVINRLGFNNKGAHTIAANLRYAHNRRLPIGINIGKLKDTPVGAALGDYLTCFKLLANYADYFTINISSPNTPDLRLLQKKQQLYPLLKGLCQANQEYSRKLHKPLIPLLVKVAPELSYSELDDVLEVIQNLNISGIIATNTTTSRPNEIFRESGGLSGKPLHTLALDRVRYIHKATAGKLPIIGVGGIFDPASCCRMMDAGASLVQIYTGLIYKGPFLASVLAKANRWRNATDWI
jgi:dihydroorotate dehydrogenase